VNTNIQLFLVAKYMYRYKCKTNH